MEGDDENKSDTLTTVITRVSIKPPPFRKPDTKIWFLQLETQFQNAAVTADQTKYDYVRLPDKMSNILSISSDELSKLETMADKMWEIKSTSYQTTVITCYSNDKVSFKLQEQASELSLPINELNKRQFSVHQQFRLRSRSKFINRRSNREHSIYYHSRFSNKAFQMH
ncbi:hypothetical protein NPIL_12821 [Nephila pilipes]|uniref:DUF7041 domain-containing protein n=1 Tax=Nephila pilipes TaxID=299642 RepID=A0A8X6NU05_NEPPI|nr:hypothetical protein NPIL_661961 [Nephila pilipes]GFT33012.1 hypothetical protein NPIL_12821 [Nephila pilipes]